MDEKDIYSNDSTLANLNLCTLSLESDVNPQVKQERNKKNEHLIQQEAAELEKVESQIRKNIAASSSFTDVRNNCAENETNCGHKATHACPPNEERSAPEGTSSPDPRSLEDSEVRGSKKSECSHSEQVNALLKKQAEQFEERILRNGIIAAEKEKEFLDQLKEEKSQLQKVTDSRDALLKLVDQYKGMLATLVSEKDKKSTNDEEKLQNMVIEKKQAIEDLANVEAAFSDVHRKYERTKQIVDTLRRNEDTLKKAIEDYEEKLLLQEKRFMEFQKRTEQKMKEANEEFQVARRSTDQEMLKMGALLKKAEMKIISLQEALERKNTENQELTKLCDDLISKVGTT